MDDGDVGPQRRHCDQRLAGEGAKDFADRRVVFREVRAAMGSQDGERQAGGARVVGAGHIGMAVLLDLKRERPSVFDGVAETVQRADAGVAAPRENQLFRAAHPDELVIYQIRRHADQRQVFLALTDDLVTRRMGDKVREAFHGHFVAIVDKARDRRGQGGDVSHSQTDGAAAPSAPGLFFYC